MGLDKKGGLMKTAKVSITVCSDAGSFGALGPQKKKIISNVWDVKAESETEAVNKVRDKYKNNEFIVIQDIKFICWVD